MATDRSNLQVVRRRIASAAQEALRSAEDIALLAVSKTVGAEKILSLVEEGQVAFGENYVQEAMSKISFCHVHHPAPIEWHFIGPIQRNKTGLIATHFDWVHTIDRLIIAKRLSEQRPLHLPPLNVCIQVNISEEKTKSGVCSEEVLDLAEQIVGLPGLRLRGLMTIPAPFQGAEKDELALKRKPYCQLRLLKESLEQKGFLLDTLSMGMSDDLEAAVLEGSTIVRVGSALFGERQYGAG